MKLSSEINNCKSPRKWWKLVGTLLSSSQKHDIPPLTVDGKVYDNDIDKAFLFNEFFSKQTEIDESSSCLPNTNASTLTTNFISSIILKQNEVYDTLSSLDTSKACGPDLINPRLLKEAASIISYPLLKLFNRSLETATFPDVWKQANVSPVYKTGSRNEISNYRPISLLPITGKVMERCIFNRLMDHLNSNNFLCSNQSGFIPGDSTVNQLLDVTNQIGKALDSAKEVRTVFCDISKAFDRVWHRGLIYKLDKAGISGSLLHWFASYLSNREQRVTLKNNVSSWCAIKAGVPQGSILGPLLFLIYINDIVSDIKSNIRLFADDTTLFIVVDNPVFSSNTINCDLDTISRWADQWLVTFNPSKTESLLISTKKVPVSHSTIYFSGKPIQEVKYMYHKHLGLIFSNNGHWNNHVEAILGKASSRLNVLRKNKFVLNRRSLEMLYFSYVRPILEYADIIWDNISVELAKKLENLNIEAARIVSGATKLASTERLLKEVGWDTLINRRKKHKVIHFHKMVHGLTPENLSSLLPPKHNEIHEYPTRYGHLYTEIKCHTTHYKDSFLPSTVKIWNKLPINVQQNPSLSNLKRFLRSDSHTVPYYFYSGSRQSQIMHTRLRLECSSLNAHLYSRNINDSPNCTCGSPETAQHFLLDCPIYAKPRRLILEQLPFNINAETILYGDKNLSNLDNETIFHAVHKFIDASKRFKF